MERIYSRYIIGYNSLLSGYIRDILQDTTVYGADIFEIYYRIQQFMERIYSTQDISESKTLSCGRVTRILQTSGERQEQNQTGLSTGSLVNPLGQFQKKVKKTSKISKLFYVKLLLIFIFPMFLILNNKCAKTILKRSLRHVGFAQFLRITSARVKF